MWRAHTARVPYYVKRPLMMWRPHFFNPSPGVRGGAVPVVVVGAAVRCRLCAVQGKGKQPGGDGESLPSISTVPARRITCSPCRPYLSLVPIGGSSSSFQISTFKCSCFPLISGYLFLLLNFSHYPIGYLDTCMEY